MWAVQVLKELVFEYNSLLKYFTCCVLLPTHFYLFRMEFCPPGQ